MQHCEAVLPTNKTGIALRAKPITTNIAEPLASWGLSYR